MEQVRQKASGKLSVPMWVGDLPAFERLVSVLRELEKEAQRLALISANLESEEADFKKRYSFMDSKGRDAAWERHLADGRDRIAEALGLRMTATQTRFEQELDGDPESVLQEVDLDDLKSVSLRLGSLYTGYLTEGFGLQVDFHRRDGGSVRMSAPKSDWVLLANEKLKVALRGRRPWYWFLRKWWFLYPALVVVLGGTILYLEWPLLSRGGNGVSSLAFVSWVVYIGLFVGAYFGVLRLIPAFELYRPGQRAIGARVVIFIGTAIAWIAALVIPQFLK